MLQCSVFIETPEHSGGKSSPATLTVKGQGGIQGYTTDMEGDIQAITTDMHHVPRAARELTDSEADMGRGWTSGTCVTVEDIVLQAEDVNKEDVSCFLSPAEPADYGDGDYEQSGLLREQRRGVRFKDHTGPEDTGAPLTWRAKATASYILIGSFTAGYCMTALNSPGQLIKDFMNYTSISRGRGQMAEDTQTSLYGLLSAIFAIGAGLGSLCTQKIADVAGRKNLMAFCAVAGVFSSLLMGLSKQAGSYELLFVGRTVSGIMAGVVIALAPVYLAEVMPHRYVGSSLLINTLIVLVAVAVVGIMGFDDLFATPTLWPVIVGSHGVLAVIQLLTMCVAVPSPYFLLNKQKGQEATQALRLLRGRKYDVELELQEMRETAKAHRQEQELTIIQLLQTPALRRPLPVAIMAFISMFFTGVIIVTFYSVQVLEAVGLSERVSRYVATAVMSASILATVLAIVFLHRLKRRHMMLAGLGGLFVFGGVLSISLIFGENIFWLQILGVVCIPLMAASHAFGPGEVPWLLIPELFAGPARGAASSLCVMVLWLALFVIGYAFPPMQRALGPYSVLPFVGLSAFFFIVFLVLQPETLGTAIQEKTSPTVQSPHKAMTAESTGSNGSVATEGTPKEKTEDSLEKTLQVSVDSSGNEQEDTRL